MKLKVRDSHAVLNGIKAEYEMPSGSLDIIGQDGKTLFCISVEEGQLKVCASGQIKHGKTVLGDQLAVMAEANNVVKVFRLPYE